MLKITDSFVHKCHRNFERGITATVIKPGLPKPPTTVLVGALVNSPVRASRYADEEGISSHVTRISIRVAVLNAHVRVDVRLAVDDYLGLVPDVPNLSVQVSRFPAIEDRRGIA